MTRVGVISDTHGLLRPEAVAFLRGSDFLVHGGDIGSQDVLNSLASLAPITAVRGNNDKGAWAKTLAHSEVLQVEGVSIYIIHNIAELDLDPKTGGFAVVVSGHSHKPSVEKRDGVFYVNPGSAGPRRFKLPVAVAEIAITGCSIDARIVELEL